MPGQPVRRAHAGRQPKQIGALLQRIGVMPKAAIVDLGCRSSFPNITHVALVHRGKCSSLSRSMALAQAAPSHRAADWAHQAGPRHVALPAQKQRGRYAVRGAVQRLILAAGYRRNNSYGIAGANHRTAPVLSCDHLVVHSNTEKTPQFPAVAEPLGDAREHSLQRIADLAYGQTRCFDTFHSRC